MTGLIWRLFTHPFLLFFLTLLTAAAMISSSSAQVNITLDDADPAFTYTPSSAWSAQPGCGICAMQLDAAQTHAGTWHDATFNFRAGGPSDAVQTVSLQFTGTAIYVFGISQTCSVESSEDYVFTIDGAHAASRQVPLKTTNTGCTNQQIYNTLLYSKTGLLNAPHEFVFQNGRVGTVEASLALFDYVVYTTEDGGAAGDGTSGGSNQASAGGTSAQPPPAAQSQAPSQAQQQSPPPNQGQVQNNNAGDTAPSGSPQVGSNPGTPNTAPNSLGPSPSSPKSLASGSLLTVQALPTGSTPNALALPNNTVYLSVVSGSTILVTAPITSLPSSGTSLASPMPSDGFSPSTPSSSKSPSMRTILIASLTSGVLILILCLTIFLILRRRRTTHPTSVAEGDGDDGPLSPYEFGHDFSTIPPEKEMGYTFGVSSVASRDSKARASASTGTATLSPVEPVVNGVSAVVVMEGERATWTVSMSDSEPPPEYRA